MDKQLLVLGASLLLASAAFGAEKITNHSIVSTDQFRSILASDYEVKKRLPTIIKTSSSYVCCAYSCGYTGCRYKWVRPQACSIVGSPTSDSNCDM